MGEPGASRSPALSGGSAIEHSLEFLGLKHVLRGWYISPQFWQIQCVAFSSFIFSHLIDSSVCVYVCAQVHFLGSLPHGKVSRDISMSMEASAEAGSRRRWLWGLGNVCACLCPPFSMNSAMWHP